MVCGGWGLSSQSRFIKLIESVLHDRRSVEKGRRLAFRRRICLSLLVLSFAFLLYFYFYFYFGLFKT